MKDNSVIHQQITKTLLVKVIPGIILYLGMFFLPAGTWAYWQAWVYMAVIFIPAGFELFYFWRHDPELLKRRMKTSESDRGQKIIIAFSALFLVPAFILPGFDVRLGWSKVPAGLSLLADGVVLLGYLIFFQVLKANSFASRVVEVETGQKVISSGPYAIVRHPMYIGVFLVYLFSPLALGSFWAMLPAASILFVLVFRILGEEKILARDLPGYREYMAKVKFRLIPGVW